MRSDPGQSRPVLITGGSGFIGSNLADRLAGEGRKVLILDNLSRPGVERNLSWLQSRHGNRIDIMLADVTDSTDVRKAVSQAGMVFHFAAQVAVTTSLSDPLRDFEVNARGTLNVLEAIRHQPDPPPLLYTSTNKVYGEIGGMACISRDGRHVPEDPELSRHGVSEEQSLDFYSPYGCSKGAADQYVLDYARVFGLPTVVFRMSCIYGPRQFGTEDQGWIAHFLIRALEGKGITIFGDGRQVRDVLYVGDLVEAMLLASGRMDELAGRAFNIGGGPGNSVSLLEVLELIGGLTGRSPEILFDDWRPGDQRYYVSDISSFRSATGWSPETGVTEGLSRLHRWLESSLRQVRETRPAREVVVR